MPDYKRGFAEFRDLVEPDFAETRRVRAAAEDAYRTMDAAVRWAATQTGGIKSAVDADRHVSGFDALLAGQVRLGRALGILSDLDPDPLYVGRWTVPPSCCDLACYEDSDCTCNGCKALDAGLAAFVAEYSTEPEPPTRIFLWIGAAVVVAAILLWVTLR